MHPENEPTADLRATIAELNKSIAHQIDIRDQLQCRLEEEDRPAAAMARAKRLGWGGIIKGCGVTAAITWLTTRIREPVGIALAASGGAVVVNALLQPVITPHDPPPSNEAGPRPSAAQPYTPPAPPPLRPRRSPSPTVESTTAPPPSTPEPTPEPTASLTQTPTPTPAPISAPSAPATPEPPTDERGPDVPTPEVTPSTPPAAPTPAPAPAAKCLVNVILIPGAGLLCRR